MDAAGRHRDRWQQTMVRPLSPHPRRRKIRAGRQRRAGRGAAVARCHRAQRCLPAHPVQGRARGGADSGARGQLLNRGARLSQPQHVWQSKDPRNLVRSIGNPGCCGWDTRAPKTGLGADWRKPHNPLFANQTWRLNGTNRSCGRWAHGREHGAALERGRLPGHRRLRRARGIGGETGRGNRRGSLPATGARHGIGGRHHHRGHR